jgi:hypothetical protein
MAGKARFGALSSFSDTKTAAIQDLVMVGLQTNMNRRWLAKYRLYTQNPQVGVLSVIAWFRQLSIADWSLSA